MTQDINAIHIQPLLTRFEEAYAALCIGEFSHDLVLESIKNGPGKVLSAFQRKLNDQLDKEKVTSAKLRAIHINRFYGEIYKFKKAYENLIIAISNKDESNSLPINKSINNPSLN